jgi:hypothetical protein
MASRLWAQTLHIDEQPMDTADDDDDRTVDRSRPTDSKPAA